MNEILSKSKIYIMIKNFAILACNGFQESFLYKIFFSDINDGAFSKSLIFRMFFYIKKFLIFIDNAFKQSFIIKTLRKYKPSSVNDIVSTSKLLKAFSLNESKLNFPFLILLTLLFAAGFLPTMVVVAICILCFVATLFENDFKNKIADTKTLVTDVFVGLYLVAVTYSAIISNDPQRIQIFLVYFVFISLYYAIRYYLCTMEKIQMAVSAFTLSGVVVCAYGALQYVTGSYKTTTWTDTQLFSDIAGRVVATFENPNVFGEYLLFIIPLCVAMFLITDKKLWKLIYGGLFFLSCGCMVLTYSRGCWLGLIFGGLIFILMMYPKLIIPFFAVLPFSIFVLPQSILNRFTSIGNLQDGSTAFRVYVWRGSISMLKDYWPCGIGLGTTAFKNNYVPYAYDSIIAPHSHNTFLHVMGESGIFGLLVFVVLLFFVFKQLFNTYKNSKNKKIKIMATAFITGLSAFLVQGMFDNTFYNYRMYMIFFASISLACSLSNVKEE